MTHLESTAIQVTLAGRPVKILAAFLSPSRPLIRADLAACFGWGLPVLMAGDLNAKRVDWNSRLTARRGKLLRDYTDKNSYLIFASDTPNTKPYNTYATPEVFEIVITRKLNSPVHLHLYRVSRMYRYKARKQYLFETTGQTGKKEPQHRATHTFAMVVS
jgi:hypothetical protein